MLSHTMFRACAGKIGSPRRTASLCHKQNRSEDAPQFTMNIVSDLQRINFISVFLASSLPDSERVPAILSSTTTNWLRERKRDQARKPDHRTGTQATMLRLSLLSCMHSQMQQIEIIHRRRVQCHGHTLSVFWTRE